MKKIHSISEFENLSNLKSKYLNNMFNSFIEIENYKNYKYKIDQKIEKKEK